MELRHLRYFIAVAKTENVSRAAQELHVSQPALSRQIRDLEDELGFALFERTPKSLRLTEVGRVFLTEARAVWQRADEAVKTARAFAARETGELHVGYAPSPTIRMLPPTLRAFQAALPHVRVKLHDLSTEEMLAGLRKGHLQIALMVRPCRAMLRGLRFNELATDKVCLVVAQNHPLARRRGVSIAEIAREPLIVYSRAEYPDYHGMLTEMFGNTKPHIAEEHDGITSIIAAVESGAGVAVLTESVACIAGLRLRFIPIVPAPAPLVIGATWSVDGFSAVVEKFFQCARQAGAGDSVSSVGPG